MTIDLAIYHFARCEALPRNALTLQVAIEFLGSWQPVLRAYRKRMWTEELYGDLKGHGFNLEATRLGTVLRLERLVLAVSLVYVWLLAFGSWVVKNGLRHYVDRRSRRDKSYFRIGWDYLERQLRLEHPFRVVFQPYL